MYTCTHKTPNKQSQFTFEVFQGHNYHLMHKKPLCLTIKNLITLFHNSSPTYFNISLCANLLIEMAISLNWPLILVPKVIYLEQFCHVCDWWFTIWLTERDRVEDLAISSALFSKLQPFTYVFSTCEIVSWRVGFKQYFIRCQVSGIVFMLR